MAYNKLNSMDVKGRVSSSTQGMVVGSFDIMPEPTQYEYGIVVMYIGDTGDGFTQNHLYKCISGESGYSWLDVTPIIDPIFVPNYVLGTNNHGNIHTTQITETELDCLMNVESNIQAQIDDLSESTVQGLADKVDKVAGKQLSTEDFTTREQEKLSSIAFGAQVNNIEEVQLNGITIQPQDKIVSLSVLYGKTYPLGNLTAGQGKEVYHDVNQPVFSIQVRDGNGKVVKGEMSVDDTVATIIPESDADNCTMYLICGGI